MTRLITNNFSTTLNGAITDVATSMTLTSVTGFPAVGSGDTCQVTLDDGGGNIEIVQATAIAGSVITIVRAQEGTSGFAFADLDPVEIRDTALLYTDVLASDLTPKPVGPVDLSGSGVYVGFGGSSTSTAYNLTHAGNVPILTGAANYKYTFTSTSLVMNAGTSWYSLVMANSGGFTCTTNNVVRIQANNSGVQFGATGARITTVLDEDAMGTDSATALATQQSIKAYVDNGPGTYKGFRAIRSAAQVISTATYTKLQLNTESYDTEGDFDPTTNYRHTPTVAGKYLYIGIVSIASLATDKFILAALRSNGGGSDAETIAFVSAATSPWVQISLIIEMNGSTDYMELFLYHNHGSDLSTQAAGSVNNLTSYYLGA